jgi:hypothetical protein
MRQGREGSAAKGAKAAAEALGVEEGEVRRELLGFYSHDW